MPEMLPWRDSPQPPMPPRRAGIPPEGYDIYPSFPLESGQIQAGYRGLALQLAARRVVTLDGFGGVLWQQVRAGLENEFKLLGVTVHWQAVHEALLAEDQVNRLIRPAVGNDDPVFGTRFSGELADFFDLETLHGFKPATNTDLNILYGTGAALAGWQGCLVYFDVPKNEVQYRSRAGAICNLGARSPAPPGEMYKRFYFVDWVVLNEHKRKLLPQLDFFVDEQRPDEIAWMPAEALRRGLEAMSRNYFRPRPWFEPGVWGGRWCLDHIPRLAQNVPNYAWSFEFISPENGLVFESDGWLLEASFDLLMYQGQRQVLGEYAGRFGYEFPLRFNFLDTMRGGELAIQCHPRQDYIRDHFGERIAQMESYYILDCEPGSRVYLGFQEGIDPQEFRGALEQSLHNLEPLEIERYVRVYPTQRHDYYLLPSATIHAAGSNNLVLEISATPYIFTFKLYDWLARDLNGKLRPLHLEHGFNNLDFRRQGQQVEAELISHPQVTRQGPGWQLVHLPTHPEQFYDVYRFDFQDKFEWETDGSFNVLNLVEGGPVALETQSGYYPRFNWAETFVVPAAAGLCRLLNKGPGQAKVVMACMKKDIPGIYG
jgi:mannose-6-phosphate isomerase class I